jgi:hypothetical protein
MKKYRKTLLLLTMMIVLVTVFSTLTLARVRAQYDGACGELDGVPGLLKKAGLLAQGGCDADRATGACLATERCGKRNLGTCTTVPSQNARKPFDCRCVIAAEEQ